MSSSVNSVKVGVKTPGLANMQSKMESLFPLWPHSDSWLVFTIRIYHSLTALVTRKSAKYEFTQSQFVGTKDE